MHRFRDSQHLNTFLGGIVAGAGFLLGLLLVAVLVLGIVAGADYLGGVR